MIRIVLASLLLLPSAGCLLPSARLQRAECVPVVKEGVLDSLRFTADIRTTGMAGEQLVYEVVLVNKRLQPIPSRDARYKNKSGAIAAGRTFLIGDSSWRLEGVEVSLPGKQLELRRSDLPVKAEFTLYRANGDVLAKKLVEVRITARRDRSDAREGAPSGEERSPPRDAAQAETETRAADRRDAAPAETAPPSGEPPDPPPDERTRAAADPPPADAPRSASREPTPPRGVPAGREPSAASAPERSATARTPRARRVRPPEGSDAAVQRQIAPPMTQPAGGVSPNEESLDRHQRLAAALDATPARAAATSSSPARPNEYVVQDGDTLSGIAQRELGDSRLWMDLFELNLDRIDDPDRIPIGARLRMPSRAPSSRPSVP